jgi:two-component system chemotaxis sensor kinase CheA
MDPAEYLPLFIAECREHLQELNVAIVALEKQPDDADGVDAIFRVVHSVKGMAATMGFAGMARLTHEMEEVFELVRQRRGAVSLAAIDVVLECLDELSSAIDAVEQTGEEKIDPDPLIPRLRALVRAPDLIEPPNEQRASGPLPAGALIVHVEFAAGVEMPSVLAYLLLSGLREQQLLDGSSPTEDELESWSGRTVEVLCAAGVELSDIEAVASEVDGVARVAPAGQEAPEPLDTPELAAELDDDTVAAPVASEPGALPAAPSGVARARTVRVDSERLDHLMHYMGELVVHRTQLASLVAQADVPGLAQAMQELERTAQALGAMVMKVRMIEVEAVFARLPRLVRDVAGKLGKEVELVVMGADTELDRTVVDALGDPLVHLVRNAIDHGLESRDERTAAGKPGVGRLYISARQAGGGVVITVRDDGRGVDPEHVALRARERGLLAPGEEITMEQAIDFLFTAGFSTARNLSDISGRGVGLDAARNQVRALGGDVVLQSEAGGGTLTEIRLPLTLAITSALIVEVEKLPYAIPLDRVEWTLALEDHNVRMAAGQAMLVLPEGVVPLWDAALLLTGSASSQPPEHAVILRVGDQLLALSVGDLVGQRELVTRPLPPELELSRPVSAGAMLAEGEIALIVDCEALADSIPKEVARALAA